MKRDLKFFLWFMWSVNFSKITAPNIIRTHSLQPSRYTLTSTLTAKQSWVSIYLSDHSQPKEEPDHTDKSGKHFFAVAAPQVVRIQIHNGGHNTLDTYKLNLWRNKKKSVIADSRRKVWEKIRKETVRVAFVVYNGRCPLTRFWREIASALYIPQMSKRLSDYQRPSLPNSYCPPTPLLPLSLVPFNVVLHGNIWI